MEHKTVSDDMPVEAVEALKGNGEDVSRPSTPAVVTLLKNLKRAAERGVVVGVAIGSVLDTLQVDGCSRSRNDIVVHNLLKAATHLASLDFSKRVASALFSRDVWDPPVGEVIALVRARLELAEAGHVRGVVVAMVGSNYDLDVVAVGDGTILVSNLLVAVHAELAHSVMHAMSLVPDGPRMPVVMPDERTQGA